MYNEIPTFVLKHPPQWYTVHSPIGSPSPAIPHLLITLNSSYLTRCEETRRRSPPLAPDIAPVPPGGECLLSLLSFLSWCLVVTRVPYFQVIFPSEPGASLVK